MLTISIVVPCYKVEQYIDQCVTSLCEQTYKNIEIILVDDGSPDKTGEMCDAYAAKDSRIIVIHKKNAGVSAARNDGLLAATGDYVIFVDSDDYIPVDACEKLVVSAEQTDADMVIGDIIMVNGEKEKYARFFEKAFEISEEKNIDELVCAVMYKNYCPNPPASGPAFGYGSPTNKLVRRSMLIDNGIQFDTRVKGIYDDIIYSMYSTACSKKITYIAEPVYYYRLVQGSLTHSYRKDMPEVADAILNTVQEFLDKYDSNDRYIKAYYALCIRMISYSLGRYYCNKRNDESILALARKLRKVMGNEPYLSAARYAEVNKLTSGQKRLIKLVRLRAALLTIVYYRFVSKE